MGLRPGPLGELVVRPQGDELFQGHGAARAGKTAVLRCGRNCGTCGRKSGGFARSTGTAGSAYIRKHLATQGPSSALAASALFAHEPQQEDAMSRILKIAAALAVLASLGACTVLPPRSPIAGRASASSALVRRRITLRRHPTTRHPTTRHPPMVAIGAGVATAIVTGSAVNTQRRARPPALENRDRTLSKRREQSLWARMPQFR